MSSSLFPEEACTCLVGAVYKAFDKETQKHVAIKKVTDPFLLGPDDGARVTLELEAMLKAEECPQIVSLLNVPMPDEEEIEDIFIVMELMPGSLKSLLKRNYEPVSLECEKLLMLDLLLAFRYIHENLHLEYRDLKADHCLYNGLDDLSTCTLKL
eukprot:Cvel_16415.t1-p1 / transcript=Cvel_16415.t1 / gene=Cvel_16415 / organism=Chromera_velia_CCMP2878 / gene_product=Mitogen-activated protein kinase 19, putative / transcript_product=Mitogen-activated protein kinase 19, putative / location=Cvel_scaffold1263:46342-51030(+) / protein_length=154 / sequence_SO=supercontig / SO=protein_coding / is_pseudo=false